MTILPFQETPSSVDRQWFYLKISNYSSCIFLQDVMTTKWQKHSVSACIYFWSVSHHLQTSVIGQKWLHQELHHMGCTKWETWYRIILKVETSFSLSLMMVLWTSERRLDVLPNTSGCWLSNKKKKWLKFCIMKSLSSLIADLQTKWLH